MPLRRPQRLRNDLADRPDIGDGQIAVHRLHLLPYRAQHGPGIVLRAEENRHGGTVDRDMPRYARHSGPR